MTHLQQNQVHGNGLLVHVESVMVEEAATADCLVLIQQNFLYLELLWMWCLRWRGLQRGLHLLVDWQMMSCQSASFVTFVERPFKPHLCKIVHILNVKVCTYILT